MNNRAKQLGVKKEEKGTQNRILRDPRSEATRFNTDSLSVVLDVGCEQGKCRA